MIKRIAILSPLLFACVLSYGQESLDKQVTVTRSFDHTLSSATKSSFMPLEESISVSSAELDYSITPTPIEYSLTTTKLAWDDIDLSRETSKSIFSARAAMGFPMQTLLDGYYGNTLPYNLTAGLLVNHYGYYGKLINDADIKESAGNSTNHLGAFLNYNKSKFEASVKLGYDHNSYKKYGYLYREQPIDGEGKERYNIFNLNISAGTPLDSYSDGVYGGVAFDLTTGSNIAKAADTKTDISGRVGVSIGNAGAIDLGLGFTSLARSDNFYDQNYQNLDITPTYSFVSKLMKLRVGIKYLASLYGDDQELFDQKKRHILPVANLELITGKSAFVPYLKVDAQSQINSLAQMSYLNPYLQEATPLPTTINQDMSLGIKGSIGSFFQYNGYFGMDMVKNMVMYANVGDGSSFTPYWCDNSSFKVGAELSARVAKVVTIYGSWHYNDYGNKIGKAPSIFGEELQSDIYGVAQHRASLSATYSHNDLFEVTLSGDIVGKRTFIEYLDYYQGVASYNEVGTKCNISILGTYHYDQRWSIFAELRNLANEKLYEYNLYRGLGFNGLIGVAFKF